MKAEETYWVIEKDGKYWGVEYEDGNSKSFGWVGNVMFAEHYLHAASPGRHVPPLYKDEVEGAEMIKLIIDIEYRLVR